MIKVMPKSDYYIREIQLNDIDEVSRIHQASFHDRALSLLGLGAVRRYYLWLLTGFTEIYPICVETKDGTLAGFCFDGIYAGSFNGFLRKNAWYLIGSMLLRPWLLHNPIVRDQTKLAISTLKRTIRTRLRKFGRTTARPRPRIGSNPSSSLGVLSIAVDPAFQRQGIGQLLMHEVERIALENKYIQLHLSVHPENISAVNFYLELGWQKALLNETWNGKMFKRLQG